MKKLIAACLLLLATTAAAIAQGRGSRSMVRIRLTDEAPLTVEVDGRNYGRTGRSITVADLPPGRHRVRVYRLFTNGNSRRRAKVVYEGYVRTAPRSFYLLLVDPSSGSVDIRTRNMDGNVTDPMSGPTTVSAPGGSAFTEADMSSLNSSVAGRITDGDKLKSMQTALDGRTATTTQVRTMMGWLNFESTRLDLAKWMYGRVTDRADYQKLENEFSFDASREEFNNYLRDNPAQR